MAVLREYDDEEDLPAFALMSPESFKLWLAILVLCGDFVLGGRKSDHVAPEKIRSRRPNLATYP